MITENPRLTEFDPVRKIYRLKPYVATGSHIQNLGKYEDKDAICGTEVKKEKPEDLVTEIFYYKCPTCEKPTILSLHFDEEELHREAFCSHCGQHLQLHWNSNISS